MEKGLRPRGSFAIRPHKTLHILGGVKIFNFSKNSFQEIISKSKKKCDVLCGRSLKDVLLMNRECGWKIA